MPVAEPLNKPLTIMFNEDGIALITRAAALDDDVRANWGRRMLLAAARKRIAEEEAAAAESKPEGQTRGK